MLKQTTVQYSLDCQWDSYFEQNITILLDLWYYLASIHFMNDFIFLWKVHDCKESVKMSRIFFEYCGCYGNSTYFLHNNGMCSLHPKGTIFMKCVYKVYELFILSFLLSLFFTCFVHIYKKNLCTAYCGHVSLSLYMTWIICGLGYEWNTCNM